MASKAWGWLTLLLIILLVAAAVWIGITHDHSLLRWQYAAVVVVFVGLCLIAGIMVNGRPEGILIDDRNRISLSRLQWVSWTIVLLGAYFVEAAWNVVNVAVNSSLDTAFPAMQPELFGLLGIVSVSPVVSNIVVDAKKQSPPLPGPQAAGDAPGQKGLIDTNHSAAEASWADLYLGEEASNRYVVDVSRLQNLIITVLLVLSYLASLWATFDPAKSGALGMPSVGTQFLTLLGVSHGGYLAYKATPKTPS